MDVPTSVATTRRQSQHRISFTERLRVDITTKRRRIQWSSNFLVGWRFETTAWYIHCYVPFGTAFTTNDSTRIWYIVININATTRDAHHRNTSHRFFFIVRSISNCTRQCLVTKFWYWAHPVVIGCRITGTIKFHSNKFAIFEFYKWTSRYGTDFGPIESSWTGLQCWFCV